MNTKLEWQDRYATGIEEIDFQHRYFLLLVVRIIEELGDIDDPGGHRPLLDELARYAGFHFLSEENMMRRMGYPDLEHHRQLHIDLLTTLTGKIGLYQEGMVSVEEVTGFLVDWFVRHTVHEDGKIGAFLAARGS